MESSIILITAIAIVLVAVIAVLGLSFVLLRAFQLINTMNKRQVFLLERMYEFMGVFANSTVRNMDLDLESLEKEINTIVKDGPQEEPYDPFKEATENGEDFD